MGDDYEGMTVEELREEVRSREISGTSGMSKADLVSTLEADDRGELGEDDEGGKSSGGGKSGVDSARGVEGTPPKVGAEGGIIEEGTGDFAPGTVSGEHSPPPQGVDTVTTTDSLGNEFEVEAGFDGENPVSAQNPPEKALLGGSNPPNPAPPEVEE